MDGDVDVVRRLIDARDGDGRTPLRVACYCDYADVVRVLLEYGTDVDVRDEDGWAPLHVACRDGHVEIARMLLENGADVNARDMDGQTPLHVACYWDHATVVMMLKLWMVEEVLSLCDMWEVSDAIGDGN